MELLIAVLIGLGVVTSTEAEKLAGDEKAVSELIEQQQISQKQIEDQRTIFDIEEADM